MRGSSGDVIHDIHLLLDIGYQYSGITDHYRKEMRTGLPADALSFLKVLRISRDSYIHSFWLVPI